MLTENLQFLALLTATLAVVSGFIVLAPKAFWTFPDGLKPYLEGRTVAWFYLVVCGSTILSILHLLLLSHWSLTEGHNQIGNMLNSVWMGWHILTSLFVVGLHFVIYHLRSRSIEELRLW
jgi:hypothetical protein